MIMPLNWMDILPAFAIVWPIGLIAALVEALLARRKGSLRASFLYFVLLRSLQFGTLFSIFGIAQALNRRGFIPDEMYFLIMFLAVLSSLSSAWLVGISKLPKISQP